MNDAFSAHNGTELAMDIRQKCNLWWPHFAEFPEFCAFLHSQNLENSFSVMKKLMFTLAAVAVAFTSAQAQKQMGEEHNIEVSFNPFSGSPIDASVIKYRKFLDDDAALRVSLGLNNTTNSYLVAPENTLQQSGAEGTITHPDLFLTNNASSWSLSLGYEKHFRGTDNLSPYVALAVGYGSNTANLTREHFSALNILDASAAGSWEGETDPANWGVWSYSNIVKSNQLNVDLLFGADYYINDAIYVGFEAGLRFSNTAGITSTISTTDDNAFNIYFDGGSGSGGDDALVVNTLSDGNYQWSSATPVEYIINGEPWLPGNQPLYEAVDNLWADWTSQSPDTEDSLFDDPRAAYFNGSNFLGTYSTGMLRVGFLFN